MSKRPAAAANSNVSKTPASARPIHLSDLAAGMPGLTVPAGGRLAEAAAVCLESQNHKGGVSLNAAGVTPKHLQLEWENVTDQMRRTYNDLPEATEDGACGIAILVVKEATGKVVVERSAKGTGFDYWVGENDDTLLPFSDGQERLEVSGILNGSGTKVKARVAQKKKQMNPSDALANGYAAVVEFGSPIAWVERK